MFNFQYPGMMITQQPFMQAGYGPMMGVGTYNPFFSGGGGFGGGYGGGFGGGYGGYYGGQQVKPYEFWEVAPQIYPMASGGVPAAFDAGRGDIFGVAMSGLQIGSMVQDYNRYGASSIFGSVMGLADMFGQFKQGAIYESQAPNRALVQAQQQHSQITQMLLNSDQLPEGQAYQQSLQTENMYAQRAQQAETEIQKLQSSPDANNSAIQERIAILRRDAQDARISAQQQRMITNNLLTSLNDKKNMLQTEQVRLFNESQTLYGQVRHNRLSETG